MAATALAAAGALVTVTPAHAATFEVENLNDNGSGSLRQAILDANAAAGADTITFDASLSGGSPIVVNNLTVLTGTIPITGPLTITGPGSDNLSIVRDGNFDLFVTNFIEAGDLTIEGLDFIGNTDDGGGLVVPSPGVDVANITLRDTTWAGFEPNHTGGVLDVLRAAGNVRILNSTFADNSASGHGGAVSLFDVDGLVEISDSIFTGNSTGSDGGAAWIADPASVQISRSTFSGNSAFGNGGALILDEIQGDSLIELTTFDGNYADSNDASGTGYGGAIYVNIVFFDVSLTIRQSSILNSSLRSGDPTSYGAGLYIDVVGGDVIVDSSTFAGGQFVDSDGDPSAGAGLSIGLCAIASGSLTVINSTFDEGVDLDSYDIHACEVSGNINILYSTLVGPGILQIDDNELGDAFITSSILNATTFPAVTVGTGTPVDVEWSLLSTADDSSINAGAGNTFNVANFLLGPLQINGGPTKTRLLLPGSPALDKGDPAVSGQPAFDQRGTGFPRVIGRIDIGAIEMPRILPPTGEPVSGAVGLAGILLLLAGVGLAVQGRRAILRHRSR